MKRIKGLNFLRKKDNRTHKSTAEAVDGLYKSCPKCLKMYEEKDAMQLGYVCPNCKHLFTLNATQRIDFVTDSFLKFETQLQFKNPLDFLGYDEKIKKLQETTNLDDAILSGIATINKQKFIIVAMDTRFLMGSMGTVLGEQVTYSIEQATKNKLPIIIFSASGGARMQEGMYSLMQMAKTSMAVARHDEANQLMINVLCNPTTGGVSASFATLGDIILAEPNALIGFAGKRVIEQTINQKLPEDFQSAEFQQSIGQIDAIIDRKKLKSTLEYLLTIHAEVNHENSI